MLCDYYSEIFYFLVNSLSMPGMISWPLTRTLYPRNTFAMPKASLRIMSFYHSFCPLSPHFAHVQSHNCRLLLSLLIPSSLCPSTID
jgi:hypothetical protein